MNDTAQVLAAIEAYIRRFLVLSEAQFVGLTLWVAHTYVFDAFNTTPYLIVSSAEMRSGKTRVFETVECIVHRPFFTTAITEAALFRLIDEMKPTLLMDESDRMFKEHHGGLSEKQDSIVGIINMGYRRKGAVIRIGLTRELEFFKSFCPKAFAGIGRLPQTVEDRGLSIRMTRKRESDTVEDWDDDVTEADGDAIKAQCEAWAPGTMTLLRGTKPDMPVALDDRARQAYRVLMAIANRAEDEWPMRAADALVELRNESKESPKESQGTRLLRDMGLFADKLVKIPRIATTDLLSLLYADGEQPWSDWWGPIFNESKPAKKAPRRLALQLSEYGLEPERWQEDGSRMRGYDTAGLLEMIERYGHNMGTLDHLALSEGLEATSTRAANGSVPVLQEAANPHESSGWPSLPVSDADTSGWGLNEGYETGH